MSEGPDRQAPGMGAVHVVPMIVIAAIAVVLWRPATWTMSNDNERAKIADLAALLGSRPAGAQAIDDRVRSFGPFPPEEQASRSLAEALVTCDTAKLDDSQRAQLAQHIYGVTVTADDRVEAIPAALLGIQQSAAAAGCSPPTVDALINAARAVARTDPNPRRDWW